MRVIPARQDGIRGGRGWIGGPRCPCLLIGLACSGQPCQLATCPPYIPTYICICSGATVRLSTDAGKAQSQAMTSWRPQGARHFGRLTSQPQPGGRPGVLAAQPWPREMAAARGGLCMTAREVAGVACARRIAIFPDAAGQSEGINRNARTLTKEGHSRPALGDRAAPAWPAWAENDDRTAAVGAPQLVTLCGASTWRHGDWAGGGGR
ncbi:hypothetical protein BT67DRAFT_108446 [Trichocladium antarcticum]|uniref:Uncharacterized protein n=1 Tax=Trichocladium antarcticum TaxID=1450529 RepID=A0AAN6UQX7_9PEZI|nr:hypothetical protein BT67DRAFT_108446 [Trichocladium antarcticum]